MYKNILLLAMAILLSPGWSADPLEIRMDEVLRYYSEDARSFMGSAVVARGGNPVYHKAFGWANREWEVKNVVDGKFRVGSVSKQFTAAAILLLEEEGKLKVEDPVSKHLKDAPPAWEKITIHHLLNHTSGIPNFTSFKEYGDFKRQPHSLQQLYERFRDRALDFPPGEKWSYSNSGYEAAGLIVEKVSGVEYGDFLRDRVFGPAGMKDSGSEKNKPLLEKRVAGYTPASGGLRNADYIDMSIPVGAGSIYSTTGDLVKWESALFGGKVISGASLKKMTTAYLGEYGYGLHVRKGGGRERFEHAGALTDSTHS